MTMIVPGTKIADTILDSGYTFQQELLFQALKREVTTGMLMTNPRSTGFTSFARERVSAQIQSTKNYSLMTNRFTDEDYYKYYWRKGKCAVPNKSVYRFDATRGIKGNKEKLTKVLQSDELAYLKFKKYK